METETVKTQMPLPLEFMDEPNGDADMILEYQGCPLVTIRGTDDMSCIDNDEDEEKYRLEQLAIAKYVRRACNSHYELLEACKKLMSYIDNGMLVRNTANDAEDGWAIKMLPFVQDLQAAQEAIRKAEPK